MSTHATLEALNSYVKSLRSTPKRDYARRYIAWFTAGKVNAEPLSGTLSRMGAQGVRMAVTEITNRHEESQK